MLNWKLANNKFSIVKLKRPTYRLSQLFKTTLSKNRFNMVHVNGGVLGIHLNNYKNLYYNLLVLANYLTPTWLSDMINN